MESSGSGGRKRERSHPEEDLEFMPLSKRITCLNLNPGSEEARGRAQAQGPSHHGGHGGHGQGSPYDDNNRGGGGMGGYGFGGGCGSQSSGSSDHYTSSLSDNQSQSPSHSNSDYTYKNGFNGCWDESSIDCDMGMGMESGSGSGFQTPSVFHPSQNGGGGGGEGLRMSPMSGGGFVHTSLSNGSGFETPYSFLYEPSLDPMTNPFYYEQNRHLFDLYLERLQRKNETPHPDVIRVTVRGDQLNINSPFAK